jgi:putative acetyltransferase
MGSTTSISSGPQPERLMVRLYEKRDLQAVAALYTDSVHQLTGSRYNLEQREAWAPMPPDLKQWRFRLRSLHTLVADVRTQVVGFLSYQPDGYIDLLYVKPGFERTGIATRLYKCVEEILVKSGVGSAYTEASLIARPFFKGCGFHATTFEEIKRGSAILQRWVMYKSLEGQ